MHITKMQALGNDYLYIFGEAPVNAPELSRSLSDRHFGAGSDGMIYISPSELADFKMRIFNADGSEAKMCGNGIRCVAKYVYDKGHTDKTFLTVETLSGIKELKLTVADGKVSSVEVDMGKTAVSEELTLDINGQSVTLIPVSVGNPHAVILCNDAEVAPLTVLGPMIEHHPVFFDGVNVEFVSPLDGNKLRMRVWERGSGVTLACGTGSCAAVAAAVSKGIFDVEKPVTVLLDGGELEIIIQKNGHAIMRGPAEFVYEAEI